MRLLHYTMNLLIKLLLKVSASLVTVSYLLYIVIVARSLYPKVNKKIKNMPDCCHIIISLFVFFI